MKKHLERNNVEVVGIYLLWERVVRLEALDNPAIWWAPAELRDERMKYS